MDITPQTSLIAPDDAPRVDEYNRFAWLYDLIVPSQLYHRLVWGMDPREHAHFAERALAAEAPGHVLDAGAGSLVFTAHVYAQTKRPITLLDASRGMLARAQKRLGKRSEGAAAHVSFVHGDLLKLPFDDSRFGAVFHFGVLHCIESASGVLSELHRVTAPEGRIFLSSLVLQRTRGDAFLRKLHAGGHVAKPRTPSEVIALMEKRHWKVTESTSRGSFLFVEAQRT